MIVRIMGEGQVEISSDDIAVLNELDSELESAIETDDEEIFREKLHALLDKVRHVGKALPDDSLEPSELILPPRTPPSRKSGRCWATRASSLVNR